MRNQFNKFLDNTSEFLAHRKGLLPLLGILLVLANFIVQFFPQASWLSGNDLLLHLGIILSIVGIMVAWAL